jgi:hypothetical protein
VRNEEERAAWQAASATHAAAQCVVVEASAPPTALTRLCGWAPQDQRASGSVPRTQG